jgi:hypothetical protein
MRHVGAVDVIALAPCGELDRVFTTSDWRSACGKHLRLRRDLRLFLQTIDLGSCSLLVCFSKVVKSDAEVRTRTTLR